MRETPVAVLLSGGVDSAIAAVRLQASGAAVRGVHLRLGAEAGAAAEADARRVAEAVGVPLSVVDLATEFRDEVIRPYAEAYAAGRTPNPCAVCNPRIKLGRLAARLEAEQGITQMATGHHARVEREEGAGRWRLCRGRDRRKDQSYFLFGLDQEQLARTRFPVGGLTKDEVRAEATRRALPVADKAESQEACFVHPDRRAALVAGLAETAPGDIVDRDGRILGRHPGLQHFTVGQRKGLGLAAPEPLHVVALDAARNRVVVGPRRDLDVTGLILVGYNAVSAPLDAARQLALQVRYRAEPVPATASPGDAPGTVAVRFAKPYGPVAPGQAGVLYDGALVIGGGWIAGTVPP